LIGDSDEVFKFDTNIVIQNSGAGVELKKIHAMKFINNTLRNNEYQIKCDIESQINFELLYSMNSKISGPNYQEQESLCPQLENCNIF